MGAEMTKDEALKLALEALQWNWGGEPLPTLELQAINAIKEVLAQPEQESDDLTADDLTAAYLSGLYDGKNKYAPQRKQGQEPVEWDGKCVLGHCGSPAGCEDSDCCRADFTTPPQRKPLTDEQISNIGKESRAVEGSHILPVTFARAIEAAHGIKGE